MTCAGRRHRCRPRGALLDVTLAEPARLRVVLARRSCRRAHGSRHCRYRTVDACTIEAAAGRNRIRLGRRFDGRRLRPGRYRVTISSTGHAPASSLLRVR